MPCDEREQLHPGENIITQFKHENIRGFFFNKTKKRLVQNLRRHKFGLRLTALYLRYRAVKTRMVLKAFLSTNPWRTKPF